MKPQATASHSSEVDCATDSATDPAFALRITNFYARSPNAAYTNAALGALALAVMWGRASTLLITAWFACVVAINVASLMLHRASLRVHGSAHDPARWAGYSTLWMLASGLVWGGGGALLMPSDQPLLQAFWLVMVNGIAAGVVAANAFHRPAQLAYLWPLLGLPIARLLLEGSGIHLAIATGMILYLAFCVVQGAQQTRLLRETIDTRFENERLVLALRAQTKTANEARAVAEAAARDKARFFAAASHDLRQPLHALGLFNEALAQTHPDAAQQELIAHMGSGLGALEDLLHELLDISRLDAGAVMVAARAVQVKELVDRAALETSAIDKGLRFAMIGPDKLWDQWVLADPMLIRRIIGNLAANAIRYTTSGSVVVACRRDAAGLRLEVRDSGVGIAVTEHANIFNEFYQLNNPGRERRAGVGLGLATAQRLAVLSGTRITLRSAPDYGSCFAFTLPLASDTHLNHTSSPTQNNADLLYGAVIAVIDDDPMVRDGISALLTSWQAHPICAASSSEMLLKLKGQSPRVLISDWMLAHEDGLAAVATVQQAYPRLAAILATADSSAQRQAAARERNLPLLVKPFQPARLRAALNALLARPLAEIT